MKMNTQHHQQQLRGRIKPSVTLSSRDGLDALHAVHPKQGRRTLGKFCKNVKNW